EVQGSYTVTYLENLYGNNDCLEPPWNVTPLQYAVTDVANSRNDNIKGLFPIYGDKETDGTPWEFWDCDSIPATNCNTGLYYNPNMSKTKAERYIDSILAYALPRLYSGMDLELLSTQEVLKSIDILTYPNPAIEEVEINTPEQYMMRSISVFNIKGTLISTVSDINANYFHLPVNKLPPGLYVLKFQFDQGIAARQIIVH
ncbi:MAG: T9SS type A sorting domain-containing protein, partial [Saprospiraceae bacterium]